MEDCLDIHSLSELPLAEEVGVETPEFFKVSLPVYCLSLFRSPSWKRSGPGFLVFTDFTTVKDAAIAYTDLISPAVTREYYLEDGSRVYDVEKLMSMSVSAFKFTSVSSELKKSFGLKGQDVDFTDKYKCHFEDKGVFARATFTLKSYKGKLESSYASLAIINSTNLNHLYPSTNPKERGKLTKLLENFRKTASPFIYARVCGSSDILRIIEGDIDVTTDKQILEHNNKHGFSEKHNVIERPKKLQKVPNGMNLLYHQHVSVDDTQGPVSTQTQCSQRFAQSQAQIESQSSSLPFLEDKEYNHGSDSKSPQELDMESLDGFLINKVKVEQILSLPLDVAIEKKDKIYAVDAYIVGCLPYSPFFVKPYNRTLKATNFKLVLKLHPQSDAHLLVEFNTNDEICRFLQVLEIEEAFDLMQSINQVFIKVADNPALLHKNLKLKCEVSSFGDHYHRPYWTCLSTLNDMSRPFRN